MSLLRAGLFLFCFVFSSLASGALSTDEIFRLPNISQIDDQVFKKLGVNRFFSLFFIFNNKNVVISDEPYTIFAPSGKFNSNEMSAVQTKEQLEQLLLNHIILGAKIDPLNLTDNTYRTLGNREIHITTKDGNFYVNNAGIIESKIVQPNGVIIVIDSYLFLDQPPDKGDGIKNKTFEKPASVLPLIKRKEEKDMVAPKTSSTFMENLFRVLFYLKSGVREFRELLSQSNVSKLINDGDEYTVLVPIDRAFQRWSPIDWGFYPFSVPEFTESVMINHFIKGNHKYENIRDGDSVKTLGGEEVIFRKDPTLTVNGILVLKGDTPLEKGNIMFISDVLFVNESIVSDLHQHHRDKETPPLLAFPWFGAQFLSHAFLALERNSRFKQITRFLNLADLAPYVSGHGYTFFVPIDTAFEELGLDRMPDNYLSNSEGLQMLLNHFVKGRLYNKDLKDGLNLQTLGNKSISVSRKNDQLKVNNATVIESEVFVYNLGTMYYVNRLLFTSSNLLSDTRIMKSNQTISSKEFEHVTPPTVTDSFTSDSTSVNSLLNNEEFTTDPDSISIIFPPSDSSEIQNITEIK